MAAPKKPRPRPDELRALAVSEGRQLLARGGPEYVKARDIAAAIGASVGTVYNLFDDLDMLLFEISGQLYDELFAVVESAATDSQTSGADLRGQLMALARAYLRFVGEKPDLWSGVLAFNRRRKLNVPAWYRDKERALLQVLREALIPLSTANDVRASLAPQALWAAVHGIITVSVGRDGLLATENEIAAQIELIVHAVVEKLSPEDVGQQSGK